MMLYEEAVKRAEAAEKERDECRERAAREAARVQRGADATSRELGNLYREIDRLRADAQAGLFEGARKLAKASGVLVNSDPPQAGAYEGYRAEIAALREVLAEATGLLSRLAEYLEELKERRAQLRDATGLLAAVALPETAERSDYEAIRAFLTDHQQAGTSHAPETTPEVPKCAAWCADENCKGWPACPDEPTAADKGRTPGERLTLDTIAGGGCVHSSGCECSKAREQIWAQRDEAHAEIAALREALERAKKRLDHPPNASHGEMVREARTEGLAAGHTQTKTLIEALKEVARYGQDEGGVRFCEICGSAEGTEHR